MEKKVLFNFKKADLIDKLLQDKAETEHRSKSSVLECFILDSFLPQNKDANDIVQNHLYNDNGGTLEQTIAALFNYNSSVGIDALHDNLLQLIHFTMRKMLLEGNAHPIGDTAIIENCIFQYETLFNIVENAYKENSAIKATWILRQIDFEKQLLNDLKNEPSKVLLSDLYQMILDNWNLLKDLSLTYRFLSNLVMLQDWSNSNTCENRLELLQIICDISSEW